MPALKTPTTEILPTGKLPLVGISRMALAPCRLALSAALCSTVEYESPLPSPSIYISIIVVFIIGYLIFDVE